MNPADPSQAVMERDLKLNKVDELIPLAFAGVGIAGILWSAHLWRRLGARQKTVGLDGTGALTPGQMGDGKY